MALTPPSLTHRVIFQHSEYYCAWPALVRAANGDLLLSFCRTQEHIAPDGCVVTMRSTDHGETWSEPKIAFNTTIDNRDCGLTVAPDGRIVMHVWSTFWISTAYNSLPYESYAPEIVEGWMKHVANPAYLNAGHEHGGWTVISDDHGETWSEPTRGPDSVHGGIALSNGSLLIAAYRSDWCSISVHTTPDPTQPWTKRAVIRCPEIKTHRFGEPHVAQLPSGRIVVMIRCTARQYDDRRDDLHLWQTYSDDHGQTWSVPERTPMLGFPPHLTVLHDGRLLCTYGRRQAPFGERGMISDDGITWDPAKEIIIRDDNETPDLGYPASIETSPGEILTVYYQKPRYDPTNEHKHKVGIHSTRWSTRGL